MRTFKSRKFWATVAGIAAVAAAALSGEVSWGYAINKGVSILLAYIAAIGAIDTVTALKDPKP
jgi:hypothetical protein